MGVGAQVSIFIFLAVDMLEWRSVLCYPATVLSSIFLTEISYGLFNTVHNGGKELEEPQRRGSAEV